MKAYSRILIEERGHRLGFVCREIVQNDVDLLAARSSFDDIGQKSQEVFTGVTPGGLAVDLPCFHVQGRVERERPVTVVLESMFFRPARRERKYRIEAAWLKYNFPTEADLRANCTEGPTIANLRRANPVIRLTRLFIFAPRASMVKQCSPCIKSPNPAEKHQFMDPMCAPGPPKPSRLEIFGIGNVLTCVLKAICLPSGDRAPLIETLIDRRAPLIHQLTACFEDARLLLSRHCIGREGGALEYLFFGHIRVSNSDWMTIWDQPSYSDFVILMEHGFSSSPDGFGVDA